MNASSPAHPAVQISVATPAQVPLFAEWAVREGWGAGAGDAEAFAAADPAGFLLALDGDRPVGSISAVAYDAGYFFLGYYIVAPGLRGRGIGHRLFAAALQRVGAAASGLDGVIAQVPGYAANGFVPAHRTARYVGRAAAIASALDGEAVAVQPATRSDLGDLIRYDARHVPAPRAAFVGAWLDPGSPRRTLIVGDSDGLRGYATVRPLVGGGARIGPLFADDAATARALLAACAATAVTWGEDLAIDVPEPNTAATALVRDLGMTTSFACMRMYRGAVRPLPLERVWGNTSLELG